ncbi:ABC transporter permease [Pseudonocardia kunmingensis]|uniref:Iron(III) transport system permease protein n=1 Tax=Pseudonocardia kunmingensis TaxID=630975 RepID=A0A543CXX5_9PSEU|nr:iron ABC transporter permease [Pseudonocardia kunmingensis]TQM01909.1 iron(III) transport system permease protein [Pseudonocardia kunmingensis]
MAVTAAPRRSGTARSDRRPSAERLLRVAWVLAVLALIGYPIALVFGQSFLGEDGGVTLGNYAVLGTEPLLLEATLNSLWIAVGTSVAGLLLGMPIAWLVVRTDMPLRGFFRASALLTFAAPSFIAALGWILLLGPNSGVLNQFLMAVFGLQEAPFDIFTPWGIIFVLALFLYPLVFLPVAASLEGIDPAMEHAASGLGASRLRVLCTVTFPLVLPSMIAGTILVFVTSFVIFGPVALLGAPAQFQTIPTVLLTLMNFPPRIEVAAVVAVPVLALVAALLLVQRKLVGTRRFTVIGGKPGRQDVVRLGAYTPLALALCSLVLVLSIILPFGILLATSMRRAIGLPLGPDNFVLTQNYAEVFAQPRVSAAMGNSFALAVGGTAVALVVALVASWLVHRSRARSNALVGPVMAAPLAFPGAILGIGIIIAYAGVPFGLGGTLLILLIGYVGNALPLTYAYVHAGLGQIGSDVEEASRSLGAPWLRTTTRITVPLLRPSLLAAGLLNFVLLFRELELSVFLYTGANPTIATVLYGFANESRYQLAGALSVVVLTINIGVTMLAVRLLGRRLSTE